MSLPSPGEAAPPAGFGAYAPTGAQRALIAAAHATVLKRGSFRPAMSRMLERLRAGPIDAAFQGGSFRLHHRDSATERAALLNPAYDAAEIDFLRSALPAGGIAVDLGANVGIYAIPLARHVGPGGRVLAVEPHPLAQRRLAFNVAASSLSNVTEVAAAASDADGTVAIETDGENLGASRVVASGSVGTRHEVPSRTLERLLHEAGVTSVDALKIDVEGNEDRVLAGFFRSAPAALWPLAVAIEHLSRPDWSEDPIGSMLERGYRVEGRTRSNTLLRLLTPARRPG